MAYLSELTSAIPNLQLLQNRLESRHLFLGGLDDKAITSHKQSFVASAQMCLSGLLRLEMAEVRLHPVNL